MLIFLLIIFFLFILLFLYCSLVLAKESDKYMEEEINNINNKIN